MGGASKGRVKKTRAKATTPSMRRATRAAGANGSRRGSLASIERMFAEFKDPDADKIGPEGLQALFEKLDVDPCDIISLVFAWKLKAKVPCEFSRAEFVDGCTVLDADSIPKLKQALPGLKSLLDDEENFRSFYMYSFDYNKPPEQRSIPIETAKNLFPLIMEGRFKHLDLWTDFLQSRTHAISKDTFSLLLDFALTINDDMSNFDEENGAWPVLLDEFVDYARPRLSQKMET